MGCRFAAYDLGCTLIQVALKYNYTIIQAPADFGKKDELQKFLNDMNAVDGKIEHIVPLQSRWLLIIYKA